MNRYRTCFAYFITLACNPHRHYHYGQAVKSGHRFRRNLFHRLFGCNSERKGLGLPLAFTVEDRNTRGILVNLHLHMLLGGHPRLSEPLIREIWGKEVGRKVASIGVDVKSIGKDIADSDAIGYVCKRVNPERGVELWLPKTLLYTAQNPLQGNRSNTYKKGGSLLRARGVQ